MTRSQIKRARKKFVAELGKLDKKRWSIRLQMHELTRKCSYPEKYITGWVGESPCHYCPDCGWRTEQTVGD